MSFNKRYISKESVMTQLKSGGSLSKLLNADALIMDTWSTKFFKNYINSNTYNSIRKKLIDDTRFSSNHNSTTEHENYLKLKSLPNILENLYLEPNWLEILITFDVLGSEGISDDKKGKFSELKEIAKFKIESYYTSESRSERLKDILN